MKILILAAGYAVRLYPLTLDTPKSLLDIGKRTIIDRIFDKIEALRGVDAIYIITNEKFFGKFKAWLEASPWRQSVNLINDGSASDETRLGAIKDLYIAIIKESIDSDLLVIAGDNLFDFDLSRFLSFAFDKRDGISVALYDIKDIKAARQFGVVKINDDNRVINFEEKPENPKSTLISTGIYYFPKEKLSLIKQYVTLGDKKIDAPGYYISWLSRVDKVYGFTFREDWYDIGNLESYRKADREYLRKEKQR